MSPGDETLIWYRLAAKLGCPVQVLQRLTTSREFVRWKVWLMEEPNEFSPLYYYLAMIASLIVQVNSDKPDSVKMEDFLLKFEPKGGHRKAAEETGPPKDLASRVAASKAAWMQLGKNPAKSAPGKRNGRPNKGPQTMRG